MHGVDEAFGVLLPVAQHLLDLTIIVDRLAAAGSVAQPQLGLPHFIMRWLSVPEHSSSNSPSEARMPWMRSRARCTLRLEGMVMRCRS
ncbi:MAG: hypothetical protein EOP82_02715 [Variovorax sp.]|nr:MAG: hypothetical protein EOP82_02715 [Variovorax sp.]